MAFTFVRRSRALCLSRKYLRFIPSRAAIWFAIQTHFRQCFRYSMFQVHLQQMMNRIARQPRQWWWKWCFGRRSVPYCCIGFPLNMGCGCLRTIKQTLIEFSPSTAFCKQRKSCATISFSASPLPRHLISLS